MTGIEAIDAPEGEVCTFETDELTALCPFDFGGPDLYKLRIRYETTGATAEARSLKQYLESFRNREITAEELANQIHIEVAETIEPAALYVELKQARRGGIEETVEVGDEF